MTTNSPGWAVELVGDKIDIGDLRELLAYPFNPWLEDLQTDDDLQPLLRSKNWADLDEAADVFHDATRMIQQLHGAALLVHHDARPVKLGMTVRFGLDGKREPTIFAATGHIRISGGRARGRIGRASAEPPEESSMQRWFRQAETDDIRAELFVHLSRADNWYDLFKSMELAERLFGGEHALKSAIGADRSKWGRIRQTANRYRHAPNNKAYPLPENPPELEEAREAVLKIISRLL